MVTVSVDDVRRVAELARLGLTDERVEALSRDLNMILEHMEVLSKVKTDAVAEAAGVGAAGLPLSKDGGPPGSLTERLESFAPAMRAGFILVPRLATHEDSEQSA